MEHTNPGMGYPTGSACLPNPFKNMSRSFLINPFIRWIMPIKCHFKACKMPIRRES